MNSKKIIAVIGAATLGALAWALPATAQSSEITVPDEFCVDVTKTIDNPDYVAARTETIPAVGEPTIEVIDQPAVEEVSHKEWKYSKHGGQGFEYFDNDTFKYQVKVDGGFEGTDQKPRHGTYYERTQHTKTVVTVEASDATYKTVDNPDYVAESVVEHPAVGEQTLTVSDGTECDVWVTWEAPQWAPNATDANSIDWPQEFVQFGQGSPTECETTYQVDHYVGTPEEINEVIGDGTLSNNGGPEDSGIVTDWYFESTNECEPEVTTHLPACTTVTGEQAITGDGVMSVEGNWSTNVINVPFSGTLADIGTVLDVNASLTQYLGLHIDTAEGTLVFEEEASYNGNLWSTSSWDGVEPGLGYAAMGSIEDYIALNGDVVVNGIRLLYTHPEASTTTVESFTIGCTLYVFEETLIEDPEPIQGEDVSYVGECTDPLDGTRTYTTVTEHWIQPFIWDDETQDWVLGEKEVISSEGVVEGVTNDETCAEVTEPPVVEPPVEKTPTKTAPPAVAVVAKATFTG